MVETNGDTHSYVPSGRHLKSIWDFSHVLDLANTLSPSAPAAAQDNTSPPGTAHDHHDDVPELTDGSAASSLGNFNKVFDFLGTPHGAPAPALSAATPPASDHGGEKEVYISDGAVSYAPPNHGVKWKEYQNPFDVLADKLAAEADVDAGADADADNFGTTPESPSKPACGLTKSQKKRANRKARREAEAEADQPAAKSKTVSDLESEDDKRARKQPAKKASAHGKPVKKNAQSDTMYAYLQRSKVAAGTPQVSEAINNTSQPDQMAATEPKNSRNAANISETRPSDPIDIPGRSSSRMLDSSTSPFNLSRQSPEKQPKQLLRPSALTLVPSSVLPRTPKQKKSAGATSTQAGLDSGYQDASMNKNPLYFQGAGSPMPNQAYEHHNTFSNQAPLYFQSSGSPNSKGPSKQLIIRDKDDRNIHFFLTLINNFVEDKHWLAKPAQLVNHIGSPDGIHVFIDFSNIHIGFQNRIRTVRGLPSHAHIRREDLDFDAFVLLMERRRPVCKRVLVGSLPHIPAFEKAKAIGYETNILDKVYKARELTDRQKYFARRDERRRNGHANTPHVSGDNGGASSDPETGAAANQPQFAKEAWVEQGVDEILHLKILESVVDVEKPSTIVLATGDAAQAEYSQGFLRMAERAMLKGWRVELVSWRDGISHAYQKNPFRQKWGNQFRIIELDDYVEDLLDT